MYQITELKYQTKLFFFVQQSKLTLNVMVQCVNVSGLRRPVSGGFG